MGVCWTALQINFFLPSDKCMPKIPNLFSFQSFSAGRPQITGGQLQLSLLEHRSQRKLKSLSLHESEISHSIGDYNLKNIKIRGIRGKNVLLTVLSWVSSCDSGLRTPSLMVSSLDLNLIGHKGWSVLHHEWVSFNDVLLPVLFHILSPVAHLVFQTWSIVLNG